MAHLPIQHQTAIANWRAFHDAGLYKKRKLYTDNYEGKIVCIGKESALDTGHYIILNLLRGLPPHRGYGEENQAYQETAAQLKRLAANKDQSLARYTSVFRMYDFYLRKLIQERL